MSIQKDTLINSRDFKGLKRSYVRNQEPRLNIIIKNVPITPIAQEITKVLADLVPGTGDKDQI